MSFFGRSGDGGAVLVASDSGGRSKTAKDDADSGSDGGDGGGGGD
jgi:hypothetical protein